MSDSAERCCIGVVLILMMFGYHIITNNHLDDIQVQIAGYQDSVDVLIAENKKLHAAQIAYSDRIVSATGLKHFNLDTTSYDIRLSKFMTLQEVEHGKEN